MGCVVSEEPTSKRRRARRPSEAAARLERLRQRNADQLQAQREAERRIEAALKTYVDADVSISTVERERDDKIAALEHQIEQIRETGRVKTEQIRVRQALAVWQLHTAGRSVEQIAELLECPRKEARRLLSAGRTAAEPEPDTAPDHNRTTAGNSQPTTRQQLATPPPSPADEDSGKQRSLSGIDSQQHSSHSRLVPATPNSSGQGT